MESETDTDGYSEEVMRGAAGSLYTGALKTLT